jgi:hypothetical protein
MLKIVTDDADSDDLALMPDELVTEGARRMLIAGLEVEIADCIERYRHLLDAAGLRRQGPQSREMGPKCVSRSLPTALNTIGASNWNAAISISATPTSGTKPN